MCIRVWFWGSFQRKPFFPPSAGYYCDTISHVWFEYDHDTITVAVSPFEEFAVDRYLDYVFRLAFLSNTLVLASVERKVAVYVYDRRGMDVITTDALLIHEFMQHFQQYLYRSWHTYSTMARKLSIVWYSNFLIPQPLGFAQLECPLYGVHFSEKGNDLTNTLKFNEYP